MTTSCHVALLRGIGPADPRTRNERLALAFEALGFDAVRTVVSSGNVVFHTRGAPDAAELEAHIEQGLPDLVGRAVPAIVRSRERLQAGRAPRTS